MSKRSTTRRALLFCMVLLTGVIFPVLSSAQEGRSHKVGISAAVREDQTEIMFPIWTSGNSAVVPSFAISHEATVGTWYSLGLALRGYLGTGKAVPYIGLHGAAMVTNYDAYESSWTDVILGPVVGGEYFLADRFSLGVEARLDVTIEGDREVPPYYYPDYYIYSQKTSGHTLVNSSALAQATFYF